MNQVIAEHLLKAYQADINCFGGTRKELSKKVCGSVQGLSHKIIGYRNSFLRPEELIQLQLISGGRNTVQEMSRLLGGVFVWLPAPDVPLYGLADNALMDITTTLALLFAEVKEAQSNGNICINDKYLIEKRANEFISNILVWLKILFATNEVSV